MPSAGRFGGSFSFTTSAAVEPFRIVTQGAAGVVAHSAITDVPIGVSRNRALSGGVVDVRWTNSSGLQEISTAAVFAINVVVYIAVGGQVTDSSANSATKVGVSRTASLAINDVIQVQMYLPV